MSDLLTKFDAWLSDGGPAALVIREHLMPVEGEDGVLFPPTFAAAEEKSKFPGGYNIDATQDGKNVCLIDSDADVWLRDRHFVASGESCEASASTARTSDSNQAKPQRP